MQVFNYFDKTEYGTSASVDNYRLYSQRFYMPNDLSSYSSETETIVFNAWNNTACDIVFGGDYSIERKNG